MNAAALLSSLPAQRPGPARLAPRWTSILACLLLAFGPTAPGRAAAPDQPARIGFSRNMFRGVNENDAQASIRTYAASMARDAHLSVAPHPILFDGVEALRALIRADAVDTVSLTIDEYLSVGEGYLGGPLMMSTVDGENSDQYVLVVRRDSVFARVADLRGRRLLLLDNVRSSFAPYWLEVLLATEGLGPPAGFFSEISRHAKPAKVALPVFFKQEDACVITRRGLELLGELNPQISAQLRVLATSPQVVPALTCFRGNIPGAQAERIAAAVTRSHLWPAGKQVMTIFQCDRVELQPASRLDSTRGLWAAYLRLHPAGDSLLSPAVASPSPRATQ